MNVISNKNLNGFFTYLTKLIENENFRTSGQLSFVMEGYWILLLAFLNSCFSEWILLPSVSPKQNKSSYQFSQETDYEFLSKNFSYYSDFCPDFHNLTTMSYGTMFKEEIQSRSGLDISLEDVEEILKENEKIPKSSKDKINLVKQMENNLMNEAEEQVKALFFSPREARTTHFHFPTMESALMTISILLFGVYLSKLILKLLQSHYNRYNGVAMMTGIRTPVTLAHGRKERSMKLQKLHLLHLLDKYNARYN